MSISSRVAPSSTGTTQGTQGAPPESHSQPPPLSIAIPGDGGGADTGVRLPWWYVQCAALAV